MRRSMPGFCHQVSLGNRGLASRERTRRVGRSSWNWDCNYRLCHPEGRSIGMDLSLRLRYGWTALPMPLEVPFRHDGGCLGVQVFLRLWIAMSLRILGREIKRKTHVLLLNFSFSIMMSLFPVLNSTLAIGPLVSRIVPTYPLLGPFMTVTVSPIDRSLGPLPMAPEPTIPPVGATSAGFILERSTPVVFLIALDLGANDASERAFVTKTPPFSVISRLWRNAKNDWCVWRTRPLRAYRARIRDRNMIIIRKRTSPSTSFMLSFWRISCPSESVAIALFESRRIEI